MVEADLMDSQLTSVTDSYLYQDFVNVGCIWQSSKVTGSELSFFEGIDYQVERALSQIMSMLEKAAWHSQKS